MILTKVFYSIACCVAILSSSCNSVQQKDTITPKIDSATKSIEATRETLRKSDSIVQRMMVNFQIEQMRHAALTKTPEEKIIDRLDTIIKLLKSK